MLVSSQKLTKDSVWEAPQSGMVIFHGMNWLAVTMSADNFIPKAEAGMSTPHGSGPGATLYSPGGLGRVDSG